MVKVTLIRLYNNDNSHGCVHKLAHFVTEVPVLHFTASFTFSGSLVCSSRSAMGSEAQPRRKLKLLGLHGFRTNGNVLRQQLQKWGPALNDLFDIDCPEAPLPCVGKSEVEGRFDGPYYEWFRFNHDYTEFYHVDETLFSYISDYMKKNGPYDGFLGFSQGATLSGCLAALQEKGLALQDVPPVKVLVLLAPATLRAAHLKHIYEPPTLKVPTLAFLGEKDPKLEPGIQVLKSFENKVVITHRSGHTVARLDEAQTATAIQFFQTLLAAINGEDLADAPELPKVPADPIVVEEVQVAA